MENTNKTFEMPKVEIILFENEDVITTSNVSDDPFEMPEVK